TTSQIFKSDNLKIFIMNNKIQKKYNRNAIVYDLIEFPVEKVLYSKWKKKE
ncbi:unnamed protein product, partial [marine sediment metagenome]